MRLYTTTFGNITIETLSNALKFAVQHGNGSYSEILHDTIEASVAAARAGGYTGEVKTWSIDIAPLAVN